MKTKPYFVDTIRRWAIFLLTALALAAVLLDTHTIKSIKEAEFQAGQMRGEYLEKQRQRIKSEVIRVANTIDYEMDKVLREAKTQVKARVSVGHSIAQNLYNQNQERMPEKDIQKIIIDSLRPIRIDQGGAYYFINGLDGISKLFADRPDQEGLSLSRTGFQRKF